MKTKAEVVLFKKDKPLEQTYIEAIITPSSHLSLQKGSVKEIAVDNSRFIYEDTKKRVKLSNHSEEEISRALYLHFSTHPFCRYEFKIKSIVTE
jgi:hypothetical protein